VNSTERAATGIKEDTGRNKRRGSFAPHAMRNPRCIVITGGSSGIGEALALEYAAPGVLLALTGRDRTRLEAVAQACRAKGAETIAETVDAVDAAAMRGFIARVDSQRPLDLVIANAGVSAGTGGGAESAEQTRRILSINVDGVVNTVTPAVERLMAKARGSGEARGQIAIMASLAGFRGFPGSPAYCASKAAIKVWGEALRGELHRHGIEVCVICPGYVRSPMTQGNKYRMPMLMDAERAARIIRRGLERNRGRIAFPWPMYALVSLMAALPPALTDPLFRRLPKKQAQKAPSP
jgi:short-subunit dehydrogenase